MVDRIAGRALIFLLLFAVSCAGPVPKLHHAKHKFPDGEAFVGIPEGREFERIGVVRARADYASFDPEHVDKAEQGERSMCRNFYNRAVQDLVKFSKQKGGDAVIEVKSAVFLLDGKSQTYDTPECADDGAEGQALVQGVAIKWKPKLPRLEATPKRD